MSSLKKVLFLVAGGSGGHILPALQLGKKWNTENPDGKVVLFCSGKKLDKDIALKNDFLKKIVILNLDNLPGKKLWLYPKFFTQLLITTIKSFYYLFKFKPLKIISTGGYIAIPLCILAKVFRASVYLYELNVVPGKAVKALAPLAKNIFITFENTKFFLKNRINASRCVLENYPIRFTQKDKIFNKESIIKNLNEKFSCNFDPNKKTIFLLGGSQGSIFLNEIFKKWLQKNKNGASNFQVIHQTGELDKTDWINFYNQNSISAITFSYDENIKNYYLISDLVICRAGAGTLFELEFFEKKSLIIPLKSSYTDHQVDNAFEMVQRNPKLFFIADQDQIKLDFSVFQNKIGQVLN